MSEPDKNLRRSLLVRGANQKQIILGFSLAPLVSLVVALGLVGFFAMALTREAIAADVELASLKPLFFSLAAFVVVAAGVTLFQAVRHSHRIAGPVNRMSDSLRRIAGGETDLRIGVRGSDYLSELAEDVNAALDAVRGQAGTPAEREEEREEVGLRG